MQLKIVTFMQTIKETDMGYMSYKGYMGSIEYNEKENCLQGRVQGLRDELLSYSGLSVKEVTEKFHSSVDNYLAKCQAEDKKPKRPYNGSLNVRLSPDIHSHAAFLAERMGISLNAFIKEAVCQHFDYCSRQYGY